MAQDTQGVARFEFREAGLYERFRELLVREGFTEQGVAETLGIEKVRAVSGQDVPLLLERTAGGTPREVLVRLFLISVPVEAEACRRTLTPAWVEELLSAGLIEKNGGEISACVQLLPFEGLYLASDVPRRVEEGLSTDFVMGIGSSSLTLANFTIRRPVEQTLDLGTGCGFQALLAARHSQHVVATDRNPRAVRLAAFNARLSGCSNVECLQGDLFAPVQGREFGLVVSNPPFVISPERRYIYRDSGLGGDEITQTIVRQVPSLLAEGGFCQILCNWAHLRGQDWRQRLAVWVEGTGCDAWVLRSDTLEAGAYAAKWIRHTERDAPERFADRFRQWTEYYARQGIEAISGGLITLRRRRGRNWFRVDDAPPRMLGPAGQSVAAGFALWDFLEQHPDDASLCQVALRRSPDCRLTQTLAPCDEGWRVEQMEMSLWRGLAYSGTVDPYVVHLTARCDGKRTVGELLSELAQAAGQDLATLAPTCLAVVRRLVAQGFLLPVAFETGGSDQPAHGGP